MTERTDSASRVIRASPAQLYRAFSQPGSMERWLPPGNMTGEMLQFDFREGGSYLMRLTYDDAEEGQGKTSDDADEVEVRLVKLEADQRIEQEVVFESEDPAFSGTMRMTWTFDETGGGTLVTVRAENVPEGIRPEDHHAGLEASLENLAGFVQPEG